MKVIVKLVLCFVLSLVIQELQAQQDSITKTTNATILAEKIRAIEKSEKIKLKKKVALIRDRVESGVISEEEGVRQKKAAAKLHAKNIADRIAVAKSQHAFQKRNKKSMELAEKEEVVEEAYVYRLGKNIDIYSRNKEKRYDIRTQSDLDIAFGLNNAIIDGVSLNDTPYEIGGSRFFEIGWKWKTRLFKKSNAVRLVYGFQFQFNGLRIKDNKYLIDNNGKTELAAHPERLKKAKFRRDHLVFPVYFEFGPSKRIETKSRLRYSTWRKFKIGIGGFAGVNLGTRQKLKYDGDKGVVKEKYKNDYNSNNFVYGLAAYVSLWDNIGLYGRYNINTIFDDSHIKQNNVALGLRFGL